MRPIFCLVVVKVSVLSFFVLSTFWVAWKLAELRQSNVSPIRKLLICLGAGRGQCSSCGWGPRTIIVLLVLLGHFFFSLYISLFER